MRYQDADGVWRKWPELPYVILCDEHGVHCRSHSYDLAVKLRSNQRLVCPSADIWRWGGLPA